MRERETPEEIAGTAAQALLEAVKEMGLRLGWVNLDGKTLSQKDMGELHEAVVEAGLMAQGIDPGKTKTLELPQDSHIRSLFKRYNPFSLS